MAPRIPALLLMLVCAGACAPWDKGPPSVHPNEGRHGAVACESCHDSDGWGGLPTTCAGCHEGSRPAQHSPKACEPCHDALGWSPSTFAHELALTGGHVDLACGDCHQDQERWEGLQLACSSCHSRPGGEHLGGACHACHSLDRWTDAVVDPDLHFPLPHAGRSDCIACHRAPAGPAAGFVCTDCHAHAADVLDAAHEGIPQFGLDREDCLYCHPTGLAN